MSKKEQAICHYWFMAEGVRCTINTEFPVSFRHGTVLKGILHDLNRSHIWYALLYVLIEGYKAMREVHPSEAIESFLIDEDRINSLRLFRNAVFHFQDKPYHDKMFSLMSSPGVETWALALHGAMKDYCNTVFPGFERLADLEIEFNVAAV